jgi:phosphohistidine phosphatase SixA
MKGKLGLIRHGVFSRDALGERKGGTITNFGVNQTVALAINLKERFSEIARSDILIVSSSAQRCTQTAEIIAEELGVEHIIKMPFLWIDGNFMDDEQKLLTTGLIEKYCTSGKVLLIVAHYPTCGLFVKEIALENGLQDEFRGFGVLDNSKGVIFDFEEHIVEFI